MKRTRSTMLVALIAGSAISTSMAQVSVFPTGAHAAHNFIPFGAGTAAVPVNNSTMHQVFASTLFSGVSGGLPVTITDIGFASGSPGVNNFSVTLNLGYTTRTPGQLSAGGGLAIPTAGGGGTPNASGAVSNFYTNAAYSATVTAASTTNFGEIHFPGSFVYDPALGNLLVEIVCTSTFGATVDTTVSRSAGSAESSRAYTTTRFAPAESNTTASRMQFTYTIGTGPTGRCCFANGSCTVTTSASCGVTGGIYGGDGTNCTPNVCPQPPSGACCQFASCSILTQAACTSAGGTYQGNNTVCGSCPAVPPVFYSNCSISTGPTTLNGVAAPAGSTWSECARDETDPTTANTTAGFGGTGALRLADDFVIPAGGMNVAYIKTYAYLTGAVTPGVTAATLRILDGSPLGTPNVVFGDQTTNRLANNSFSDLYRTFNTVTPPACGGVLTAPGTTRRLQNVYIAVNQFLPAGTYWLDFNYTGASFTPPSTQSDAIGRQCTPGSDNGLQFNAAWVPLNDAGQGCVPVPIQQDVYFELLGTPGTVPCYADCDGVGGLTANDFICFVTSFNNGGTYADCDGIGGLTANDFICFVTAYNNGCS
jgi:hypothetical protein